MHDKPSTHTFVFKNISGQPIKVDNIRSTCGCTSPIWNEDVVLPDSLGTIILEYDAHKIGYFRKVARVYFSGQKKPERLVLEGEVVE